MQILKELTFFLSHVDSPDESLTNLNHTFPVGNLLQISSMLFQHPLLNESQKNYICIFHTADSKFYTKNHDMRVC